MSLEKCKFCGEVCAGKRGLNSHISNSHKDEYRKRKYKVYCLYKIHGLTQKELARKFNIGRVSIFKWIKELDDVFNECADIFSRCG